MILKILWAFLAAYQLIWKNDIIAGFLAIIILSQLEIIDKLGGKL